LVGVGVRATGVDVGTTLVGVGQTLQIPPLVVGLQPHTQLSMAPEQYGVVKDGLLVGVPVPDLGVGVRVTVGVPGLGVGVRVTVGVPGLGVGVTSVTLFLQHSFKGRLQVLPQ